MTDNELRTPEETQNPAAPAAEACAETTSPALDMAEAADLADEGSVDNAPVEETMADETAEAMASDETAAEEETQNLRRFSTMTKEELIEALREIVDNQRADANREVAAIKKAFFLLRNRESYDELAAYVDAGNAPETFSATPDPGEGALKDLLTAFKEKRNAYLEAEEARRQANLAAKREIISQLQTLADDIDNINLHFSKFHELQQEFRKIGEVPPAADTEIWKAYQSVEELFFDRLKMNKELRDLDFKKNLEAKRAIIEQAQALTEATDVIAAFRKLQTLHEEWRETGPVAKDLREEIWDEFKKASTTINKRHQDYFETRKAEEQANETAKLALCDEIEAINPDSLQSFGAWESATQKVIDIQARWKQLGFASRKTNAALFARFRQCCDNFFSRKAEYYKQTREDYAANLAKKIELCEKAEALRDKTDSREAAEEVARLQAEWKTIGPVARKQSDAVWERFITACNHFYDERKKVNSARRQEESANLDAKRDIIARLRAIPLDGDRRETLPAVRALQEEWQKVGHVPMKYKEKIYREYREVCDAYYNSLDSREKSARMSDFKGRMERMRGDRQGVLSERDKLVRAFEAKKSEFQTYENNMGFFNVKSSAGNSMLRELERKISRIKDDMAQITEKIKVIDREAAKSAKSE